MAWALSTAEQRRLVDALMEIPGLRLRATRNLIIDHLERDLGYPIPIARHEQDLYDVWQLVDACLTYPGAMGILISILDAFHQGSRPMAMVRGIVDELFPEPLLDAQMRRDLHRLLEKLDGFEKRAGRRADIVTLYEEAVGPIGPVLNNHGGDLTGVVAQLEEITADEAGIPPLLHFLERLAGYSDNPIAAELRNWVDGFAVRHDIELGKIRQIRDRVIPAIEEALPPAYLVIELVPDGVDPDFFLLSAWLQNGDEPGRTLSRDDTPVGLAELPARVTALLVEDHHVTQRTSPELTIEFVLPRCLLGYPVDQVRITIDGLERRLGIEHPVVVRSLDRLRRRVQHHNWRKKWGCLRDNPGEAACYWVDRPGDISGEGLYNTFLSEPSLVCLALAFRPAPERQAVADELAVGLQAGAPLIAWCRDRREPEHFQAEFRRLLDRGPMLLAESVLYLRRQAVGVRDSAEQHAEHLGLHLTLVLDDADRIPEPYVRLSPPA